MTTKTTETACSHNYKIANIGVGGFKAYYEKLKIVEEQKVLITVDSDPGRHYMTLFCSKCGETKEIIVKDHGEQYANAYKNLSTEERKLLVKSGLF